jgi:hypothetical protein
LAATAPAATAPAATAPPTTGVADLQVLPYDNRRHMRPIVIAYALPVGDAPGSGGHTQ